MTAKKGLLRCQRGLQSITAVLMLLLMFTALTALIMAFSNYNSSMQQQMKIEQERAQEKIAITQLDVDSAQKIENLTVSNIGAIEVRIRAIYRRENGVVTLLADPSTFTDTHIAQGTSMQINIAHLGLTPDPNATLIAATQRGVRSQEINEIELEYGEPPTGSDTSQLSIGPLMLYFDSINYTKTDVNGNPTGSWPGYPIPQGIYCAWEVNVTNIDPEKRDLIINQYTGLTLQIVGGPSTLTWFLKANQQSMAWNTTASIIFLWSTPAGDAAEKVQASNKGQNNIFLTFFGEFSDGKRLAQTIPFEAVTVG